MRYYDIVAGIGAAILSVVAPLLLTAFQGEVNLLDETTQLSPFWLLVFLVTGLVFQFARYRDEIDLGPLEASDDGPN